MQRGVPDALWIVLSLMLVVHPAPAQAQITTTLTVTTTTNTASSSTATTSTMLPPPLGRYRVYPAEGPDGPPKVSLEDRFQKEVVNLDPVGFFMVPLETNGEPIVDPLSHRACYRMWTGRFGASVDVDNRFGPQSLTVGDPAALCVPTEISSGALPPPVKRDHYKCYEAFGSSLAASQVTLSDEFQSEATVQVLEPFWFCTPVSINGKNILNHDEHLTCYTTSSSEALSAPGLIIGRNQFHESDVNVFLFEPGVLCVPSSLGTCAGDEDCDDGNPCTDDSCSPAIEVCIHTAKMASCVPPDMCSAVGQCVDGRCEGVVTGVDGLVCTLNELRSVPCVQEDLPKRLRSFISKKVKHVGRSLESAERAAGKNRHAKAEKLRRRAARQLESIPKKIRKARWRTCKETVEALVGERYQLIQEVTF